MESNEIETLRSICNVSEQRASELLEAASGSLDRAIDIYFSQQTETRIQSPEAPISQSRKKKRLQSPESLSGLKESPSSKQARIHSFFQQQQKSPSNKTKSLKSTKDCQSKVISIEDSPSSKNGKTDDIIEVAKKVPAKDQLSPVVTTKMTKPKAKPKVTFEVTFARLAQALQEMADTTKRLIKLNVLSNFIQDFINHAEECDKVYGLTCALHLILGQSGSDRPLDVSHSAVSKALQVILGVSRSQLSKASRQFGELGDSAASFFQKKSFFLSTSTPTSLSIIQLSMLLKKISTSDGRDAKQDILFQLMRSCQSKNELRFLVRLLIGNMRIGANLKTVLASLGMAICSIRGESDVSKHIRLLQKTFDICPNFEKIICALLKGGFHQMKIECGISVGTPVAPMLAHPVHSLEQVEKAMNETADSITMEFKYDGVRCQAHHDGTTTKLFSRHMLETTLQYPDAAQAIVNATRDGMNVSSFIIDSEIVAVEVDGDKTRLLPFQELSKRKRKNDDGTGVQIKVFVFDIMELNGTSYINRPLWERQQVLHEYFQETKDFCFVSSRILSSYDENAVKEFLEEAVKSGTEGLMVKMLGKIKDMKGQELVQKSGNGNSLALPSSQYEAGSRSHGFWLKVKRDYVAGYSDTIDVVPIGAWYGSGRKAQKSFLSPILLAVYDEEDDVYRSICRCMTFTDAMYSAMKDFYFHGKPYPSELEVASSSINEEGGGTKSERGEVEEGDVVIDDDDDDDDDKCNSSVQNNSKSDTDESQERVNCFPNRPSSAFVITNENPPIWFKPREVFEISFADMTLSRQHNAAAGLVDDAEGRGVALRFPRFKRRRPDKRPEQATTTVQICQLFANQSKQGSSGYSTGRIK